ncbi:MAG: TlpA family protein disulfide reductase [Treponema sp.]|nr:TlpA family protein disulfide reductase [Treponema sp.]
MDTLVSRAQLFSMLALLAFVPSWNLGAQETATQVFARAGLTLLSQGVTPRDFTLETLATTQGSNLTLSELKGKAVLLNFWATWCPPCRDEMPSMEALYRRYKDAGLEIVAVNVREDRGQVQSFMASYRLSFPAVLDADGRVSGIYGVRALPTSFLINKEGKIVARLVGFSNWDTPEKHAVFELLLK